MTCKDPSKWDKAIVTALTIKKVPRILYTLCCIHVKSICTQMYVAASWWEFITTKGCFPNLNTYKSSMGSCELTVAIQVTVSWQATHSSVTCWACSCVQCMPVVLREFTLFIISSLAPLVISFLTMFKWPALAANIRAVCPVCCRDRYHAVGHILCILLTDESGHKSTYKHTNLIPLSSACVLEMMQIIPYKVISPAFLF